MKWLSNLSTDMASSIRQNTALFHCNPSRISFFISSQLLPISRKYCSRHYSTNNCSSAGIGHFLTRLPYTTNLNITPPPLIVSTSRVLPHQTQTTQSHQSNIQYRTMSSSASLVESAKKSAAYQAVNDYLLPSYKFVGIGSGSTVVYVVEAIVSKGRDFYGNMTFIPTGSQSKGLIRAAGLNLANLDERPLENGRPVALDVAFDGADEVDEDLNLIKGGGACLFQEKLVAIAAKKFVAVADYRKQSPRLCTTWKTIPIEVLPMAAPDVLLRLQAMGSPAPAVRSGLPSKAGECVTDNGMWIIDAPFAPLLLPKDVTSGTSGDGKDGAWEVSALANELLRTPGIVEIGLFHGFNGDEAITLGKQSQAQKPVAAYFGLANGEVQVQKAA